MKFNKWTLGLAAIGALMLASSVKAQTNLDSVPNQIPPVTFFGTLGTYFTSVNTNYSFASNTFELSVGADYISGVNWANYVKGQYDIGRFDIEANFRNIGIGGQVQGVEGGVGYALIESGDTKLTGYIDGGDDFDRHCGVAEPGLTLKKKGTLNTYLEAGISWPIWFSGPVNRTPDIHVGTGFTY